jgi:hypothetical protein
MRSNDGYRLIVRRDGDTVRLFTRRCYDWAARYSTIAGAAACGRRWHYSFDLLGLPHGAGASS